MEIEDLLRLAVEKGASDLHLTANTPPVLRIDGNLTYTDLGRLSPDEIKRMVYDIMTDKQKAEFEKELELDFSLAIFKLGRFRINLHVQRGSTEAAFRTIPSRICSIEELGLPPVVADLARRPNGLVLVTGATGMGKSTTLAAMVELINIERKYLIITIEDPIEYVHHNKKGIVKQREVYSDTRSFAVALNHVLRQNPDVVVVGEMRDLETLSCALTAAETGQLVLATLHTPDAPQTIDRVIDIFPSHQQQQIIIQLANSIQGVISQQLLPREDRPGRVVAVEIMIATSAIRNLIRERKTAEISTHIQTGSKFGMKTMDGSLKDLYAKGIISYETALSRVRNLEEFERMLGG